MAWERHDGAQTWIDGRNEAVVRRNVLEPGVSWYASRFVSFNARPTPDGYDVELRDVRHGVEPGIRAAKTAALRAIRGGRR